MAPTPLPPNPSTASPERIAELAAIVALIRANTTPVDQLAARMEYYGAAVELLRPERANEEGALGLEPVVPETDLAEAVREVQTWVDAGYDVRTALDPDYPENLLGIFNRPPLLFVRGVFDPARDSRGVAIVGAREATEEGLRRAGQLSRDIAGAGFTVFSGLARGIDTAVHATALKFGGRTLAVMGTGIDRIYPAENEVLADRILESGGALLSQFFPHQPPTQWTFPKRNVVMSGLALATVVVEASATSGARLQARVALEHGRTVFLLISLVERHEWARRAVEEGVKGTRALVVRNSADILARLGATIEDTDGALV